MDRNQARMKSTGNAKAIDFYAGLKIDPKKPLNPGRKLWKDRVREDVLYEDMGQVTNLDDWEKRVLANADPKYKAIEDSDEEEKEPKKA
jgi:hypothetical protein